MYIICFYLDWNNLLIIYLRINNLFKGSNPKFNLIYFLYFKICFSCGYETDSTLTLNPNLDVPVDLQLKEQSKSAFYVDTDGTLMEYTVNF